MKTLNINLTTNNESDKAFMTLEKAQTRHTKQIRNNVYLVEILKAYNIEYKFRQTRKDYVIKTKELNTIELKPLSDSIKVACKYAILDDMRYYENYQLKYEKNTDLTDIENFIKSLIK